MQPVLVIPMLLHIAAAWPSYYEKRGECTKKGATLATANPIAPMGMPAEPGNILRVQRGSTVLSSGDGYYPDETLTSYESWTAQDHGTYWITAGSWPVSHPTNSLRISCGGNMGIPYVHESGGVPWKLPAQGAGAVRIGMGQSTGYSGNFYTQFMELVELPPMPPLPPAPPPYPPGKAPKPPPSPASPPPPPPKAPKGGGASDLPGFTYAVEPDTCSSVSFKLHYTVPNAADGTVTMAVQAARTTGWLGVGFSTAGSMVGSEAVIGWIDSGGVANVQLYALGGKTAAAVTPVSGVALSDTSLQVVGGVMTMQFKRPLATPAVPLSASSKMQVFMCAWGNSAQLSGHAGRAVFQTDLTGSAAGGAAGPLPVTDTTRMKLVHGSLMLVGWGFLLPLGVVIASQLKGYKNPLWFKLHRAIQLVGLSIALGAFTIALVQLSPFGGNLHGSLGVTVMALGLAQPLNAFIRPHPMPKTPKRALWELVHKGSGYIAVALAGATIITGIVLFDNQEKASVPNALIPMIIAYAVGVTVVVVLAIVFRSLKKDAPLNKAEPKPAGLSLGGNL